MFCKNFPKLWEILELYVRSFNITRNFVSYIYHYSPITTNMFQLTSYQQQQSILHTNTVQSKTGTQFPMVACCSPVWIPLVNINTFNMNTIWHTGLQSTVWFEIVMGFFSHLSDIVQSFMFTKMNPFSALVQLNKSFNFSEYLRS